MTATHAAAVLSASPRASPIPSTPTTTTNTAATAATDGRASSTPLPDDPPPPALPSQGQEEEAAAVVISGRWALLIRTWLPGRVRYVRLRDGEGRGGFAGYRMLGTHRYVRGRRVGGGVVFLNFI